MENYCKAIKETKLPERPSETGSGHNCFHDEERFHEFVTSDMDLRDMAQHMADFTRSGDVAHALRTIRSGLQLGLIQRLGCTGSLFEIGSFYDGSKTGRLNEMDCLYVVSEADVIVQESSLTKHCLRVYLKGTEIKPTEINEKLIDTMKEILSEMTLPDGWTPGGYSSPDFSGLRCNGPSVTAMFCNRDEKHISLDVSVAFPMTSQLQQRADFPPHLRDSCQSLEDSINKIQKELTHTQISGELHLIGNLVDDTWQPTTALAEAEILRVLKPECTVKRVLETCKVIASKLQRWYEEHNTHIVNSAKEGNDALSADGIRLHSECERDSILAALRGYSEAAAYSSAESRKRLNDTMTFQHIYLSSADRNMFGEVLKSDASINNAAIKHIILKNALQLNGAFSKTSKQLEHQLMRAVFEELSAHDFFNTQHALVPELTISKFSFSMYLSHIKESIASDFSQQCRIILDNVFATKRKSTCIYPKRHHHENLAEYCYKIEATFTSMNKLTSVSTGEDIAIVLSALINSGGGVLIISLVTKGGDVDLHKCQEEIIALLTQQENWIPEDMFANSISCTKNEADKELYFFVSKTARLLTYHSNALYLKHSNPETITNNEILMDILLTCTCEKDPSCENHTDVKKKRNILSVLPKTDNLMSNQLFDVLESDTESYFYRNYLLNDQSLSDVLKSPSLQCEILEMVSALANTTGGSIFIGVTNTATPKVVGYTLSKDDMKRTEDCIFDILTGRNRGPATIWGNPKIESTHYWGTFLHDVVSDNSVRKLIEIRVKKCPGGMFCAMPVCLDIRHSGEIYQLDSFDEWKGRLVHDAAESHHDPESDDYRKHFKSDELPVQDLPPDLSLQPARESTIDTQIVRSSEFCWWLADHVATESLQFDHCCTKELADSEMDLSDKFSSFPSTEAITERHANVQHLEEALSEILQQHQSHKGVAVFMEHVPDTTLPIYATLKDVTPVYHVLDLVILQEKQPPVLVSIFKRECPREEANNYCLTLAQLLKRDCTKSVNLEKGSMKLFFRRQLCFLGKGLSYLHDEGRYPKEYLCPSLRATDTVRYTLARILLDCQPYITDRYGNIMVKHLSAYQAKIILGRKSKVMIVASKAGSGKTVVALEMARRIKKQQGNDRKVAFFCRSGGLASFVKSQTKGTDIFQEIKTWDPSSIAIFDTQSFSKYTDVFIDDAHAIPVQGEPKTWQIYNPLFSSLQKRQAHAYIFLDPDLQDYRGCTPENFVRQLRTLAEQYVTEYNVTIECLGKSLRNSQRICQFAKACKDTINMDEFSTVRQIPDDGVFFHNIHQGEGANEYENTTLLSRLEYLLKAPARYSKKDITILTHHQTDRLRVNEMLNGKYETAVAKQFPVKSIVVDTLENFEGLESPVILFIIPYSWGSRYVGSLKYLLCVVTRAISRLEFLLPWDASQRQQGLAELKKAFSLPPVDYGSLTCVRREHKIHAVGRVAGMCYFRGRMYSTHGSLFRRRLSVYSVTDQDTVTVLDTLDLDGDASQPCVHHQSVRVYIPCGHHGISVVRYDGSKLVLVTTLRCVSEAENLAVVSPDTLYVCDGDSRTVCLVDVTQDRVTGRLQKLVGMKRQSPWHVAFLAETVLVDYGDGGLVTYRHGVPTSGKVLPRLHGLRWVSGLTTDLHSSFLLFDSRALYVLDISGNLTHTISISGDREPADCTVVWGQLWVGCKNGDIIVMSSH